MRKIFLPFIIIISSVILCFPSNTDKFDLCPVKRFTGINSPLEFAQRFQGDTIFFHVPDADNVYLESFKLLTPDTVWLKERPKNKKPQEHKHFNLITHFSSVHGWGVNAHRQYTSGNAIEHNLFVIQGIHSEHVQYLGVFNYILLEDVKSGAIIKWNYTKNENNGFIIFSPSILKHVSLMKGLDFIIEKNDSTFTTAKCEEVTFSIGVNPKAWDISLDVDFSSESGIISSRNWKPQFFLKKDEENLNRILNKNN